ncbi:MAG: hypothetical protein K2X60_00265 [Xanthobacteraceae bacterium]|nr:hypothetical protein [Xanthobacteraceae bacterium]
MGRELHGEHRTLMTIATAKMAPGCFLLWDHRDQRSLAQCTFLGCVLQGKPRQFVRFVRRQLLQGGRAVRIPHSIERGASICKPRHHSSNGAGMASR